MRLLHTMMSAALGAVLTCGLLAACGDETPTTATTSTSTMPKKKKITLGIVAKSNSNAVFQAAHHGALDAAKELGEKYNAEITINIQTPPDEDAQKQAQAVEQLARSGAQGISVSCSNGDVLQPAIDKAVEIGAVVMCFDSDSPNSKRFCYYGTDDNTAGRRVMEELAKAMGDKGTIAILAGNKSAPNLQARTQGVLDEMKEKHPNIQLLKDGVFFHQETAEKAAEMMQSAQTANPSITGWALVGGWPLFTEGQLRWEPGSVKVVSMDALKSSLTYLKSKHVQALLAQDCYGWGHRSVEILMEKIVNKKDPESKTFPRVIDPLRMVDASNMDQYSQDWDKWTQK